LKYGSLFWDKAEVAVQSLLHNVFILPTVRVQKQRDTDCCR